MISQPVTTNTTTMKNATPLFSSQGDKLARAWAECKQANPWLLSKLADVAMELKRRGHTRYSIDGIFHILRWETDLSTGDLSLKVNNNHTALAARDLMADYPELDGFFQVRERKARGNYGQLH